MIRNFGRWFAPALALAFAGALAACGSSSPPQPETRTPPKPVAQSRPPAAAVAAPRPQPAARPLRIAFLAPLSGEYADVGRDLMNGAAMALLESDAVAELLAYDTKGESAAALSAFRLAAAAQNDIVVGPLFGGNAKSLGPHLNAAGLTALAFSNDGSAAGPRVLVLGRALEAETSRIVRHAAENGARLIAVFGKADRAGIAAAGQAERDAALTTSFNVRRALYAPDTSYTDVATQIRNLVSQPDADVARVARAEQLRAQLNAAPEPASRARNRAPRANFSASLPCSTSG